MADLPDGELVRLAVAVEQEGRRIAERVRAGELTRREVVRMAAETGDAEPMFALRYLDAWGIR